jgi:uncharacterized membrane protein
MGERTVAGFLLRRYLKRYWFVALVGIFLVCLLVEIFALLIYPFLPERPPDTAPYMPQHTHINGRPPSLYGP